MKFKKVNEKKYFKAKHALLLAVAVVLAWGIGYFIFIAFTV